MNSSIHQSLRRRGVDWRFLLPTPVGGQFQHIVVLGGEADLGERLQQLGVARCVSRELPKGCRVDAVIRLHDAQESLCEAVACLAPGGVLYYEVDRRSMRTVGCTPAHLERTARRLGLTPAGVYGVAPNFDVCKRYIPLDVDGAFPWYLSTFYIAGTPIQRMIEIGLRTLIGGNGRLFGGLAPYVCFVAIAGSGRPASALGLAGLPPALQRPGLRPLMLTSGFDDASRIVMLPFGPQDKQPVAVLKISPSARYNAMTVIEQGVLTKLRSLLDERLRRTIPAPQALLPYGDLIVGAESCARGRSLWASSGQWHASLRQKIADLHLAAEWLAEFHSQTQSAQIQWDEDAIHQWVEQPFAAYINEFGVLPVEEQLFAATREYAWSLFGKKLPLVWQHCDFLPCNLYRNNNTLTVVDWEYRRSETEGIYAPPLCDLLYFIIYWLHVVYRLHDEVAELRAFDVFLAGRDPDDEVVQAIYTALAKYMKQLDLDPRFMPLFLVYTWVRRALQQAEREQLLGRQPDNGTMRNHYTQYILTLAENTTRLFRQHEVEQRGVV